MKTLEEIADSIEASDIVGVRRAMAAFEPSQLIDAFQPSMREFRNIHHILQSAYLWWPADKLLAAATAPRADGAFAQALLIRALGRSPDGRSGIFGLASKRGPFDGVNLEAMRALGLFDDATDDVAALLDALEEELFDGNAPSLSVAYAHGWGPVDLEAYLALVEASFRLGDYGRASIVQMISAHGDPEYARDTVAVPLLGYLQPSIAQPLARKIVMDRHRTLEVRLLALSVATAPGCARDLASFSVDEDDGSFGQRLHDRMNNLVGDEVFALSVDGLSQFDTHFSVALEIEMVTGLDVRMRTPAEASAMLGNRIARPDDRWGRAPGTASDGRPEY
jgi:hypothetical protein